MTSSELPALTGTEKQVKWAEDIRSAAITAYQAKLSATTNERLQTALRWSLAHIRHETWATWFIDQRSKLESAQSRINPMTNAETLRESPQRVPYRCECIAEYRKQNGYDRS